MPRPARYLAVILIVVFALDDTASPKNDDALPHLREMRDIAERFGYAWLAAWSRALLGTVAVMQGRLEQARERRSPSKAGLRRRDSGGEAAQGEWPLMCRSYAEGVQSR
jgi:tryptophanyl-tRNA synthetase